MFKFDTPIKTSPFIISRGDGVNDGMGGVFPHFVKRKEEMKKWFAHILFINLEERTDRLQHIQNELTKITAFNPSSVIQRVNAIKTANGAVGCSLSHIRCLEMAKTSGWEFVMICEDDLQILNAGLFQSQLQRLEQREPVNDWDVLLLAGNNNAPYRKLSNTLLQVHNCQTTTGYIVRASYYDKLIANFRESSALLMKNPQQEYLYALDVYWKKMQMDDRWFLSIPLCVSQYENYSDIEKRNVSYHNLMLNYDKGLAAAAQQSQKNETPIGGGIFNIQYTK